MTPLIIYAVISASLVIFITRIACWSMDEQRKENDPCSS